MVERVAAHERVDPADLPAVADVVPRDIYSCLTGGWSDQTEPIEFTYVWYQVTVYPGGEVVVTP